LPGRSCKSWLPRDSEPDVTGGGAAVDKLTIATSANAVVMSDRIVESITVDGGSRWVRAFPRRLQADKPALAINSILLFFLLIIAGKHFLDQSGEAALFGS